MARWSRWSWPLRRALRRARAEAFRHLYRDEAGDPARGIVLAGAGRSGTTWLADLICSELHARLMFEPFNGRLVPEARSLHYFHYLRPEDEDAEVLALARRVLAGDVRNCWIDRQVEVLRPRRRLVKDIRACLLLGWLHARFPEVPLLFIVRHPGAVVASRMSLGWDTDRDLEPFLAQPRLIQDHLREHEDFLRSLRTAEEKHAAIWCVSNLVPLRQLGPDALTVVFYETLWREPERELARVFRAVGHAPGPSGRARVRRPSATSRADSPVVAGSDVLARWRRELDPERAARVLAVVERFGLDGLYGDADLPRDEALARLRARPTPIH